MNYEDFESAIKELISKHSISNEHYSDIMRFLITRQQDVVKLIERLKDNECLPLLCDLQRVILKALEERMDGS